MFHIIALALFVLASAQGQDYAALVLGGVNLRTAAQLSSVELFGCPNQNSIPLAGLPVNLYATGGIYLPEQDSVLICGGYSCEEGSSFCETTNQCFTFDGSIWMPAESFRSDKYGQLLAIGPNLDDLANTDSLTTIAIGGPQNVAEIFSEDSHGWNAYK